VKQTFSEKNIFRKKTKKSNFCRKLSNVISTFLDCKEKRIDEMKTKWRVENVEALIDFCCGSILE